MLLSSVYAKSLRDARRGLLGWGLGVAGYLGFAVGSWPSYSSNTRALEEIMKTIPEAVTAAFGISDLTTAVGYLEGQVFSFTLPLLLVVFAVGAGARAIGGDEESGTLELVLTHPVPRGRLVLERFAALATSVVILVLLVFVVVAGLDAGLDLGVGVGPLAAITASIALFGLFFATLALAVGAATGRRGVALAVTTVVAVSGYAANNLAPLIGDVDWLRRLSPFYYYIGADPLRDGLDPGHAAVLGTATALTLALGLWRFARRDVGV